jgi:uncharacterized protein (UPF0332 family)
MTMKDIEERMRDKWEILESNKDWEKAGMFENVVAVAFQSTFHSENALK